DALAERWENVPTLGPVAPQWCSDAIWRGVAQRAGAGVRVHTHLLESRTQRAADPFTTLMRFGVLDPGLSAAHAVWLEDDELARARTSGAGTDRRRLGREPPPAPGELRGRRRRPGRGAAGARVA